VSTQLRLVDFPPKKPKRSGGNAPKSNAPKSRAGVNAKTNTTARGARRAVHWGAWQLDDHTRRVGRAGVAAARRALEEAQTAQELRQAS
jgi:hypothetical protein